MAGHNELGKAGERKAATYLSETGYTVLDRNWRWKGGELDIVCVRENVLVVVEVKTRTLREERPGELLDSRRCRNLRMGAEAYMGEKGMRMEVRFDLILVTGKELGLEHIPDAVQVFE